MAKSTLPVNYQDDILNSAMDGKRRYRMINNSDGTISLEDATTYDQVGSNFGAAQMNATNQAVNAAADASKIIDDIDAIRALTQEGYMAGALALKQVDSSLGEDEDGMTVHEKLDILIGNASIGDLQIIEPVFSNTGTGSTSNITNCKNGDIVIVFEDGNSTTIASVSGGTVLRSFNDIMDNSKTSAIVVRALGTSVTITQNNSSATFGNNAHVKALIIRSTS